MATIATDKFVRRALQINSKENNRMVCWWRIPNFPGFAGAAVTAVGDGEGDIITVYSLQQRYQPPLPLKCTLNEMYAKYQDTFIDRDRR